MLSIVKILRKLFQRCEPQTQPDSIKKQESEYIGSILFSLTDKGDIDILCKIPETHTLSVDQLTSLAEKYAGFLHNINDGYLIDDIFAIIKNTNKTSTEQNEQDKLFLDNILFFWAVLHVEHNKKNDQKSKGSQPIVRPSEVFKFG
jgi:hypothetical protein